MSDNGNAGQYTQQLANFADQLTFKDLPQDVIEKAKGTLLDYLGAALAGSTRPHAKKALEVILSLRCEGDSTILGSAHSTSVDRAAFLNGLYGSSTPQLDDSFKESLGHPGVGTLPAVLAVGEREQANGKEMLVSIVAGYEMAMRIGATVGREAFGRGWHPRGGCNVFASAVAAAKLLKIKGLDSYCAVLGLAGNKASGLIAAAYFHDAFYTLSGNASQDGVMAALLAQAGYDAGHTILEDVYGGYCRVVCDHPNWQRLVKNLGTKFEIMLVSQKAHASTGLTHAAIEATLSIVNQQNILPEDVEKVRIWGFSELVGTMGRAYPDNPLHATMSVPYLIAVAITDRQVLLPQVEENKLRDPQIAGLQGRMEIILDPELDKLCPEYHPARVEIKTRSGKAYIKEVKVPKGDPRNPFTKEELETKFRSLAAHVLDRSAIEETIKIVNNLEELSDTRILTKVLRGIS